VSTENGKAAHGPRPRGRFPRSPPRPGRNLGLGREFGLARAAAWAESQPARSEPSDGDRRLRVDFAQLKNPDAARPGKTLASFAPCPSLSSLAALSSLFLSAAAATERTSSGSEQRATAPSPAPSPARVLPDG